MWRSHKEIQLTTGLLSSGYIHSSGSQDHLPRGGVTHGELGVHTPNNKQDNPSQTHPETNAVMTITKLKFF